ncbi:hypothetical protein FXO38_12186 [Capsicum annuum]|uniref:Uncharacterized protein n=1 Tax=Capsicum annuum TaxID=4072 RepID=A0A2G2ZWZ3_CAPAN|nr:hypothetical protein FXO37_34600 [Capsicum annuum]KAF3660343.1 hypothetical protein FXO38_12186 [Capsicum annuum]PHT86488.1 hypothetical protein T459_08594 [Capsicum annuum]
MISVSGDFLSAKEGPSSPARKRSRPSEGKLTRVPKAPPLQWRHIQKFRFKVVRKDGKQWYTKHTDAKYILEVYIDRGSFMRECPSMVRRIEALNMNFIIHQPAECNLHLVREFYANWDPSHPEHLLKVLVSDMEFDEEEKSDDDCADDDGDDMDEAPKDMAAIVSFE